MLQLENINKFPGSYLKTITNNYINQNVINIVCSRNKHINSMEVTVGDSNEDEEKKIECEGKDKHKKMCFPLQLNLELGDEGDCLRTWSCIILAHLLRDTMLTISDNAVNAWSTEASAKAPRDYRKENHWKKRRRYLSRDKESIGWKHIF